MSLCFVVEVGFRLVRNSVVGGKSVGSVSALVGWFCLLVWWFFCLVSCLFVCLFTVVFVFFVPVFSTRVYILPKNPYLFPPPLWLTLISSLFFATFFRDIFSTHVCGAVSFITAQPMWCSMTSLGWYTYLLIKVGGVIMWGGGASVIITTFAVDFEIITG